MPARVWDRLHRVASDELPLIMARRELHRFLIGSRSRQGFLTGLLVAALLALAIPVHRAFGAESPRDTTPYFLLFCMVIQVSLCGLWGRALWVSVRRDAAAGSLEELRLTGAGAAQLLLGCWLGLAAAAVFSVLALLPVLLLAAAFSGGSPYSIPAVCLAWALSAGAGALAAALLLFSGHSTTVSLAPLYVGLQGWIAVRMLVPRLGLGPGWSDVLRWVRDLDPVTLVPAATGSLREPWSPKVIMLGALLLAGAGWLALAERDLPARPPSGMLPGLSDLLSLRPMRGWVTSRRFRRAPEYGRSVMYPFERAFGWRLRISSLAWVCVLGPGLILAVPLALIGREAHAAAAGLVLVELLAVGLIAALGAAASVAGEREQGRWALLLCCGLSVREITLAKWRAAWMESWPLCALILAQALVLVPGGALPLHSLPLLAAAPLVTAVSSSAASLALGIGAASLVSAQQRALLWVLVPPVLGIGASLLLCRLPQVGYLSLPHLTASGLGFRPSFAGGPEIALALGGHLLVGGAALSAAAWQLLRRPPLDGLET